MSTIPETLKHALIESTRHGDRVAFQDENRTLTFNQLMARVTSLTQALTAKGLKPGDRIALLSRNSVSAVECIFAACAGFILVPLNWRLSAAELSVLVQDCTPAALICENNYLDAAESALVTAADIGLLIDLDDTGRKGWLGYETLISGAKGEITAEPAPSDPALIIYTSGTTGTPKGVTIAHATLLFNMRTAGQHIVGANHNDRSLMVMPMFHVGGLCFYLLAGYLHGITTILRPQFDLNKVVEAMKSEHITNVHMVPTMIADLITHPHAKGAARSLKRIMYAGSSMPITLLERAMSIFTECEFVQAYGSTEAGSITRLTAQTHKAALTQPSQETLLKSCGQSLPDVEIRITRDDGALCKTGEPGEISVRSPGMMQGYWNNLTQTAKAIQNGYLFTGDIGYFDEKGYLYLIDRKNDMIVTGGENVFPTEVEHVLYQHPDIEEVSVFGVPDAKWIEKIVAAVRLKEGTTATEADLIAFTRRSLAAYKCPKQVLIMTELPRTGVGKVSRKTLKQIYKQQYAQTD